MCLLEQRISMFDAAISPGAEGNADGRTSVARFRMVQLPVQATRVALIPAFRRATAGTQAIWIEHTFFLYLSMPLFCPFSRFPCLLHLS